MKLNICTAVLVAAAAALTPVSFAAEKTQDLANARLAAVAAYGKLPLSFEPTESPSHFLAHSGKSTVSIGALESSVAVTDANDKTRVLHFSFVHADAGARLEALELQEGVTNYYLGQDASKWRIGVKHYAKLREQGVYPGVDVVYYGDNRQLEFDFVVAPEADPGVIVLSFSGMDKFYKDASGDLVAELNGKSVHFVKPYAYQKIAGASKPVEVDYELAAAGNVNIRLGAYDKNTELIIDPVVSYVTYLGGLAGDTGNGIAVDTTGTVPGVYVTGQTCSNDFPHGTPPSPNPSGYTYKGTCDAYVTKYSIDGTAYVFTTILGGSTPANAAASGNGIAVDASHQAYVTGTTNMSDLPGTVAATSPLSNPHSYQGGDSDAFIAILNADGTLLRSSYLGGAYADSGNGIAIDQASPPNVIVVGQTCSFNFPGYNAFETQVEDCVAFVTKLDNNLNIPSPELNSSSPGYIDPKVSAFAPPPPNAGGEKFFFSEFFGGQITTVGPVATATWSAYTPYPEFAIVYDSLQPPHSQMALNAGCSGKYVAPATTSSNPVPNWNATLYGQTPDGDVSDPRNCGTPIVWKNLGPDVLPVYHTSAAYGVAVDPPGDIFVAGGTNTPTLTPYSHYTGSGAWVLKVSGVDGSYIYGTVLETTASDLTAKADTASSIAVDSQGRAYLTGTVTGTLMTTSNAYQPTFGGGKTDAFLIRVNTAGSAFDYSTYLGGAGNDQGLGIAVDAGGSAYITGSTQSPNFPAVNPLVNPSTNNLMNTLSGTMDAFIAQFAADGSTPTFSTYLGGSGSDQGNAIAINPSLGDIYLAGNTSSADIEQLNPLGFAAPQTSNEGNGDAFVTKVAASGVGVVGLATISLPATLSFNNQTVGQSASLPVTLTNSSASAVLTISQFLSSGSKDFTVDHSACPTSLVAGKSCTITVTFLPTSAVSESATLSVSGSATNSPQSVAITGTGVTATNPGGGGSGGTASFSLTPAPTGVSVTQGSTAKYSVSVAPTNGFKGTVAMTCSVTPVISTSSKLPTCTLSAASLMLDGTTVSTVNVSVATASASAHNSTAPRFIPKSIFIAVLPFSIFGMLLIAKRRASWLVLALLVVCLLMGMAGCGSKSGSTTTPPSASTYSVVLTGTSAGTTPQTATMSLAVNPQ